MSFWNDLIQGLPTNSVLRERINFEERKFKDMEAENKRLKEELAALTKENEELKRRIADAPMAVAPPMETPKDMYGCYYFNDDPTKLYCPHCYKTQGKKHLMTRVGMMGFQCTVCPKFIHRR